MEVLFDIEGLGRLNGPLHLAVGVFDGLHLGHRAVIDAARESAEEQGGTVVVTTFEPHPIEVLSPRNAPRLLTAPSHKLHLLEREFGVGAVLVIRFDEDFRALSGEEFVRALLEAAPSAGIARVCVGEGWQFGHKRSGDTDLLRRLGEENNFAVTGVGTIQVEGMRVSSTRIREAVAGGDFEIAKRLLGRDYTVFGTVVEGRKIGRTIGFPTANFDVHREQLPPTGVYAVRATGSADGWEGVANLGYRPTVEGGVPKRVLEVHLFGLEHEIYGQDLEVEFVRFLRPEMKFDGIDALKAQIARDADTARAVFAGA